MTGWESVGWLDESFEFSASDGTHDAAGAFDFASTARSWSVPLKVDSVNPDLLRLLGVTAHRARQQFELLAEYLAPVLPPEPVCPAGRTAVGYRRARRRYGRAVKRWRRAGSPTRQHALYVPHITMEVSADVATSFVELVATSVEAG